MEEVSKIETKDEDERKKQISKIKSKRNVSNYINKIKALFGDGIKALVYHNTNSEKNNLDSLQIFCASNTKKGEPKFIITNKKLDEGVHVEDADGEIMFEVIYPTEDGKPSYRFTQQIGRCIRAIMPGESLDSVNIPVIFDYANNFMRNIERLKLDGKIMFDYDQSEIGISEFFELAEIVKQGVNKCETVTNKDRRKNAKLFCWQKEKQNSISKK